MRHFRSRVPARSARLHWATTATPKKSNAVVLGHNKTTLWKENKQQQQALKAGQPNISPWTTHQGFMQPAPPTDHEAHPAHRNSMFPAGRAGTHPAAPVLKEWATFGCPTHTGKPWSKEEMWEAVARGPHRSGISPGALEHFAAEAAEKVRMGHAWTRCMGFHQR